MGASESKVAFKEGVFRLSREDNIPIGSAWWDEVSPWPLSSQAALHSVSLLSIMHDA